MAADTQQRRGKGLGLPACYFRVKRTQSEQKIKPALTPLHSLRPKALSTGELLHCGKDTPETEAKANFQFLQCHSCEELKPVTNAPDSLRLG